jgi:hypothetical protein
LSALIVLTAIKIANAMYYTATWWKSSKIFQGIQQKSCVVLKNSMIKKRKTVVGRRGKVAAGAFFGRASLLKPDSPSWFAGALCFATAAY